jgi:hypothetical protein
MGWITADDVRCRLLPAEHAIRKLKIAAMTASGHERTAKAAQCRFEIQVADLAVSGVESDI